MWINGRSTRSNRGAVRRGQRVASLSLLSLSLLNNRVSRTFAGLSNYMRPTTINRFLIALCKQVGAVKWSRYLFHYSFERTIDLANSFAMGHHTLEKRLHELSAKSWAYRKDPKMCHIHCIDPVVLEIVASEVRETSMSAKDMVKECVNAKNDILKSVASKQAVRYLLKGIEHAVKHEVEEGNLDDTEAGMMNTCILFCQKRLRLGSVMPKPPSVLNFLRRIPFLAKLGEDMLRYVASVSTEEHFGEGTFLVKQGCGVSKGLRLILGGSICVYHRRLELSSSTKTTNDHSEDVDEDEPRSPGSSNTTDVKRKKAKLTSRWSVTRAIDTMRGSASNEQEEDSLGRCVCTAGANEFYGVLSVLTKRPHWMSAQATSMVLALHIPSRVVRKIYNIIDDVSVGLDIFFVSRARRVSKKEERENDGVTIISQDEESKMHVLRDDDIDDDVDDEVDDNEDSVLGTMYDDDDINVEESKPNYRRTKTSKINFGHGKLFTINEAEAIKFAAGCCRSAALHATISVLELDISQHFKIPGVKLREVMIPAIDRSRYVRAVVGDRLSIDAPFVLITGRLKREDDAETDVEGVRFVGKSSTVYRAEKDRWDQLVQLLVFDVENTPELSRQDGGMRRARRRLVKSFSKASGQEVTTLTHEMMTNEVDARKRKGSLFHRIVGRSDTSERSSLFDRGPDASSSHHDGHGGERERKKSNIFHDAFQRVVGGGSDGH